MKKPLKAEGNPTKSITLENTAASVCRLKKPSQAKAAPAAKAANKSSEPIRVVTPFANIAKDTY